METERSASRPRFFLCPDVNNFSRFCITLFFMVNFSGRINPSVHQDLTFAGRKNLAFGGSYGDHLRFSIIGSSAGLSQIPPCLDPQVEPTSDDRGDDEEKVMNNILHKSLRYTDLTSLIMDRFRAKRTRHIPVFSSIYIYRR